MKKNTKPSSNKINLFNIRSRTPKKKLTYKKSPKSSTWLINKPLNSMPKDCLGLSDNCKKKAEIIRRSLMRSIRNSITIPQSKY